MVKRIEVEVVDDIDGKPAAETVSFALRGVEYEIDLSEKNAASLDRALAKYVKTARRVGGRKQRPTLNRDEAELTRAS